LVPLASTGPATLLSAAGGAIAEAAGRFTREDVATAVRLLRRAIGETGKWELGVAGPTNGSIHSNTWFGSAAELANRGHIAIHPTLGWWRTRPAERRYEQRVHYSLIVTISTQNVDVDIYTPVAHQIGIAVPMEIQI
jgi:hypothetical protein